MDITEQSSLQQQSLALRRSGRQPKRTERVEEFLTTVRRRGRKNLPAALEDLNEPASCHVTDIETASEGSVDSLPDNKTTSQKRCATDSRRLSVRKAGTTKEHDDDNMEEEDTSDSDSDKLTLKELQNRLRNKNVEQKPTELTLKENRLRKKQQERDPPETLDVQAGNPIKPELAVKREPGDPDSAEPADQAVSGEVTETVQMKREMKPPMQTTSEDREESGKSKSEAEVYDPSTLYCICQQPHNNRYCLQTVHN